MQDPIYILVFNNACFKSNSLKKSPKKVTMVKKFNQKFFFKCKVTHSRYLISAQLFNSLFKDLPDLWLNKLQRPQNNAPRSLHSIPQAECWSPLTATLCLHWILCCHTLLSCCSWPNLSLCCPTSLAGLSAMPKPIFSLSFVSDWRSLVVTLFLSLTQVFGMPCHCLFIQVGCYMLSGLDFNLPFGNWSTLTVLVYLFISVFLYILKTVNCEFMYVIFDCAVHLSFATALSLVKHTELLSVWEMRHKSYYY